MAHPAGPPTAIRAPPALHLAPAPPAPTGGASLEPPRLALSSVASVGSSPPSAAPDAVTSAYDVDWAKPLGEGAFSRVYRARKRDTGAVYALKVIDLRPLRLRRTFTLDRVLREVTIMQSLKHENIVHLEAVFHTPEFLCLVQEFAGGGELFNAILELGAFPEPCAKGIIKQVLNATHYLHTVHDTVHRDIKPENIMLALGEGDASCHRGVVCKTCATVKLVDFGLAKMLGTNQSAAKTVLGTPQYIAPEVLMAGQDHRAYSFPVDCWSIGVVTYLLLCARYPFEAMDAGDTRMDSLVEADDSSTESNILHGRFWFPPSEFAGVSNAAKHFVCGLLTTDPAKRLTTEQALAHPWITGVGASTLPTVPDVPTHNHGYRPTPLSPSSTSVSDAGSTPAGFRGSFTTNGSSGLSHGSDESGASGTSGGSAGAAATATAPAPAAGAGGGGAAAAAAAATQPPVAATTPLITATPYLYTTNAAGVLTTVSSQLAELLEYPVDKLLGQPASVMFPESAQEFLQSLAVTGTCVSVPIALTTASGNPVSHMLISARCVRDKFGRVEAMHVSLSTTDSSDASDEPMTFRTNNALKLVGVSDRFLDWLDYEEDDLLGHPVHKVFVDRCQEYLMDKLLPAVKVTGLSQHQTLRFVAADGSKLPATVSIRTKSRKGAVVGLEFLAEPIAAGDSALGDPCGGLCTAPPPVVMHQPVTVAPAGGTAGDAPAGSSNGVTTAGSFMADDE